MFPPWLRGLPEAPNLPQLYGLPRLDALEFLMVTAANEEPIVPIIGDDSGKRRRLASSNFGDDPAFSALEIGGTRPAVMWNASNQQLFGETPSDWKFLHRDQCAWAAYFEARSALSSQNIATTRTAAGAQPGFGLFYIGAAANHRINVTQYGDDGNAVLAVTGALGSAPLNTPYSLVFTADSTRGTGNHGQIRLNGSLYASASYTGTPSNANPVGALQLGKGWAAGVNNWSGPQGVHIGWSAPLTVDEQLLVNSLLPTLNSLRLTQRVIFFGDSTTEGAQSHRRMFWIQVCSSTGYRYQCLGTRGPTGNWPLAAGLHEGISGQTIEQIAARITACLLEADDIVIMAGANNMGNPVADSLAKMSALIDAAKARYPNARIWILSLHYGQGTGNQTSTGNAGLYNAGVEVMCASKGVHFVNIHDPGPDIWIPAIHSLGVNDPHATPAGGDVVGMRLVRKMKIAA